MSDYDYSGSNCPLSADEVRKKDKETQIAIMREWFDHNFEPPANETRHKDGAYDYMYGGPYHPRDVLEREFYDVVPDNVISSLVNELERLEDEWAPTSHNYDYGICEMEAYEIVNPLNEFTESIKNIKTLLSASDNIPPDVVPSMHRLLYANIIIAIEVYLSDTFKNDVTINSSITRHFVETNSFFKEQKISISDIYKNMDSIKNIINTYLTTFSWHKLDKIKQIYENTFDIKFPEDVTALEDAILVRHDIMHRNGKTPYGKYHKINETIVKDLIAEAEKFVSCIEDEMNNKKSKMEIERNL